MGHPTAPQMSRTLSDTNENLWCERMQDMTGYVLPDSTSPPLDEQFDFSISSAHENDFDMLNLENPSPEEVILGDQAEGVLYDDSNYRLLDFELKTWLPTSQETEEFVNTTSAEPIGGYLPRTDSENSLVFLSQPREDKKIPPTVKKPRYLSIIAKEEPYIKEDPGALSLCTDDDKLTDMEVAAEEEVVTQQVETNMDLDQLNSPLWLRPDNPVVPKQELTDPLEEFTTLSTISPMMEAPLRLTDNEQLIADWLTSSPTNSQPRTQLHLDITAAATSGSLFTDQLPDTPEVLQPVLKPDKNFDLVQFLLANNDSNNFSTSTTFRKQAAQQHNRRGKSVLSLQELKASQVSQPAITTSTSRPRRESATRFNKRLEEGLLDSNSAFSDDEEATPKSKRRRTVSSSNRTRITSESDQSTVSDCLSKYRERRDRNNLSSKRSRQKRKEAQQIKVREMKALEVENERLQRQERKLREKIEKVKRLYKHYFRHSH